ncbi:MAG: acyltransferase [Cytophagales bacterium]
MVKKFFKTIVFYLASKIVDYSNQYRREKVYRKYNFDPTIVFDQVSFEGNIKIGSYTYINERSRIDSGPNSSIEIGQHCAIGRNVHITSKKHDLRQPTSSSKHPEINHIENDVKIGDYVWIGDNVLILPGVKIEDYAVIGANSVVNSNVKKFEIVGGVPIKHLRFNKEHNDFPEE